jgi:hypothetical protein
LVPAGRQDAAPLSAERLAQADWLAGVRMPF